jgi:hypothetical protein
MNTKTRIAAAAAILTTLATSGMASAQPAIFLPPSYTWDQMTTTDIPGDARGSVASPTRHREPHRAQPYGQW